MTAPHPPTIEDRIQGRALAANIVLTPEQLAQLAIYYRLLERWNQTINLTSLSLVGDDADRSIDKLIVEALGAADEVPGMPGVPGMDRAGVNWIDFGTGGGSPAIPLKIVRPGSALTMVEARGRKSAFLREVVSTLGLSGCRVLTMRIEAVPDAEEKGAFDLITIRAVKMEAGIAASAAALLRPGGRLVVFGRDISFVFNELLFTKLREPSLTPGTGTLSVFSRNV